MKNIVCKNDINNMRIITNIHYIQYAHDKKIKQNEKKVLTNNARYDIIRLQVEIDFNSTCVVLIQGAYDSKMKIWKMKSISKSKNENWNRLLDNYPWLGLAIG